MISISADGRFSYVKINRDGTEGKSDFNTNMKNIFVPSGGKLLVESVDEDIILRFNNKNVTIKKTENKIFNFFKISPGEEKSLDNQYLKIKLSTNTKNSYYTAKYIDLKENINDREKEVKNMNTSLELKEVSNIKIVADLKNKRSLEFWYRDTDYMYLDTYIKVLAKKGNKIEYLDFYEGISKMGTFIGNKDLDVGGIYTANILGSDLVNIYENNDMHRYTKTEKGVVKSLDNTREKYIIETNNDRTTLSDNTIFLYEGRIVSFNELKNIKDIYKKEHTISIYQEEKVSKLKLPHINYVHFQK